MDIRPIHNDVIIALLSRKSRIFGMLPKGATTRSMLISWSPWSSATKKSVGSFGSRSGAQLTCYITRSMRWATRRRNSRKFLGSRSRSSENLSRQRALTIEMMYRIHNAGKIPPELLIKPCKLRKAA
jgi:hypothetical protein